MNVFVRAICNARKSSHRFTLRSGADNADAVGREGIQIVAGDEVFIADLDESDLSADLQHILHGTAEDSNLAVAGNGCLKNLVQTVDIRREGRDKKSARGLADLLHDCHGNLLLGNREARNA